MSNSITVYNEGASFSSQGRNGPRQPTVELSMRDFFGLAHVTLTPFTKSKGQAQNCWIELSRTVHGYSGR